MSDTEIPAWQMQSYDTEGGFYVFQNHYLPQLGQRSVDEAYRQYVQQKYARSPTRASKTCRRWANALDGDDQPIPGALTWEARAKAWDAHLAQEANKEWELRAEHLRQREWKLTDALFDKAEQMLKFPLAEIEKHTSTQRLPDGKTIIENTQIINPAKWFFKDAAQVIQIASRVGRLATGQETDHSKQSGEVHQVGQTLAEWQAEQKKRRDQVAGTLRKYEDDGPVEDE